MKNNERIVVEKTEFQVLIQEVYREYIPTIGHTYVKKYVSKTFIQWLIDLVLDIFFGYEGDKAYYYECSGCKKIRKALTF